MTIDWENLKKEDLFDRKLYESISNIQDSFERIKQEENLFGVAKSFKIKSKVESLYKEVRKQSEINIRNNSTIDFGEKAPIRNMIAPGYYKDSLNHIRKSEKDKDILVTSTLIEPIAIFKNIETRDELVKCAFFSRNRWEYFIINREVIINNGKITRLANKGIDVTSDSSKLLVGFIRDLLNNNEIPEYKSTSKMGWHEGGFLPYDSNVEFDGEENFKVAFESIKEQGSYEKWYEQISEDRKDNVPLKLMMATSFASPLLYLLGKQSFVTLLWGKSGGGKTVAGRIAMSIWGDSQKGKLMFSMNNTLNFYYRTSEFFNHLPVFFDELQTFVKQGGSMDRLIMSLTEGIDRGKADLEGGTQKTRFWNNTFMFTGEESASDINSGGGTLNRLIEIYITKDVIEDGMKTCDVLNENYGHAGKIFINHLKEVGVENLRLLFRQKYDELMSMDKTEEKQAINMAVLLTADYLACNCIFTKETPLTVNDVIGYMFTKAEIDNTQRAYEVFLDECEINKNKFGEYATEFWGTKNDFEIQIVTQKLRDILSKHGFNYNKVLKGWEKKGYVERGNDGKYSQHKSIDKKRKNYVVVKIKEEE